MSEQTHGPECWRKHIECAVRRSERMEEDCDLWREAVVQLNAVNARLSMRLERLRWAFVQHIETAEAKEPEQTP